MEDLLLEAASRYQAEQHKVFKDFQKNLPDDVRQEQRQRLDQLRAGHEHLAKAFSLLKPSSETSWRSRSKSRPSVCSSSVVSVRSARSESSSVLSRQMQLRFVNASRQSSELTPASARQSSELAPASARASQVSAGMRRSQSDVSERLMPQSAYSDRWPSEPSERRMSQSQASEQRRSPSVAELSERRSVQSVQSEVRSGKPQWSDFVNQFEEEARKLYLEQGLVPMEPPSRRSQSPSGRRAPSEASSGRQGQHIEQGGNPQPSAASPAAALYAAAVASAPSGTASPSPWSVPSAYDRRRARPLHQIPGWHDSEDRGGAPAQERDAQVLETPAATPGEKPAGAALASPALGTPALEEGSTKSARFSIEEGRQALPPRPRSAPIGHRMSWQEFKQNANQASPAGSVASTVFPAGVYQGKAKRGMPAHLLLWKRRDHGRKHFAIEDHIGNQQNGDGRKERDRTLGHAKKKFPFSGRCHMFGHKPLDECRLAEENFWKGDGKIATAGLVSWQCDKRKSIDNHPDDPRNVKRDLLVEKAWYH